MKTPSENCWHLDFETYSPVDLPKFGAFRYAESEEAAILLCAVAYGTQEPLLWSCLSELSDPGVETLLRTLSESEEPICAHNAYFESAICKYLWEDTFGLPVPELERWRCTAALARRAAIPHSLEGCAQFLGVATKDKEGASLIKRFSCPIPKGGRSGERFMPEEDPKAFAAFGDYCRQDVRAEQQVYARLRPLALQGATLESWILDLKMNHLGVPVNVPALSHTNKLVGEIEKDIAKKFQEITGLRPTQNVAYLAWLKRHGYPARNLQADTLEQVLSNTPDNLGMESEAFESLALKRLYGFAALKKIPTMLGAVNSDGRVRGAFSWSGAIRTHRWAGRIIQPQNFKRPEIPDTDVLYKLLASGRADRELLYQFYENPLLAIASCIRHFIHRPGRVFLNADYSAIEARIVCWLCGQEDTLQKFRQGVDLYIAMASTIFNTPPKGVDPFQRFVGKQTVLGCGYGMGPDKFQAVCEGYGQKIGEELAELAVATYRRVNNRVKKAWKQMDEAAKAAIRNPGQVFHGTDRLRFVYSKYLGYPALVMLLPSGHKLFYPKPRIVSVPKKYRGESYESEEIQFWGPKPQSTKWAYIGTYGAKLLENATQGTAGDVMANGAVQAWKAGYPVFMLVHDEALSETGPGDGMEGFKKCLLNLPDWARGLPLDVKGDEIPYYQKD